MDLDERRSLARAFAQDREVYEQLANQITELLNALCEKNSVHVIGSRVKSEESFLSKSVKTVDGVFKYDNPLNEIEDLVGVRVICYTMSNVEQICQVVKGNFEIDQEIDKAAELIKAGTIGYVSKHFIVRLSKVRAGLPEYKTVKNLKCEVQVRTVLQHTWAELEHRLQYKSSPNSELRARFQALAGLVQVADREFEGVVALGESLIDQNKDNVDLVVDIEDDADDGHKLANAAYMFGSRPRDLVTERRYDDAIKTYDKLIELQPNQVWHYVGRAKAKALLGDILGVAWDVEKIRGLNSTDKRAKDALKKLSSIVKAHDFKWGRGGVPDRIPGVPWGYGSSGYGSTATSG